jgi:acyl carrier protein
LTADTTSDDVQDWDSLMHVTLITHVEREFGIRFTSGQVALLMDVGDLIGLIEQLTAPAGVQP